MLAWAGYEASAFSAAAGLAEVHVHHGGPRFTSSYAARIGVYAKSTNLVVVSASEK